MRSITHQQVGTVVCVMIVLFVGVSASTCHAVSADSNGTDSYQAYPLPATLDDLLVGHDSASEQDKAKSSDFLKEARAQFLRGPNGWSGATKWYMESIISKPTIEGIIGYAESSAIMPTHRISKTECHNIKQRLLARSLVYYRLAIELSEATKGPFPDAWPRSFVGNRVVCLSSYLAGHVTQKALGCAEFIETIFQSC